MSTETENELRAIIDSLIVNIKCADGYLRWGKSSHINPKRQLNDAMNEAEMRLSALQLTAIPDQVETLPGIDWDTAKEDICFCCGGKDTYLTSIGMSSIFCGVCGWREGDSQFRAKPSTAELVDMLKKQRDTIGTDSGWRYDDTHRITLQGIEFIAQITARLDELESVKAP